MVCLGLILSLAAVSHAGKFKKQTICEVQKALKALGYYSGEITGILDDSTAEAIKAFQKDKGLKADGIPGRKTRKALREALKKQSAQQPESTKESAGEE